MVYQNADPRGLQFVQEGVELCGPDPMALSDHAVRVSTQNGVTAAVAMVLYRTSPSLDVFVVNRVHSAISGLWLPSNDMARGDMWQGTARRFCRRHLGFDPTELDRFTELGVCFVQSASSGRLPDEGTHVILLLGAYLMSEQEQSALTVGITVPDEDPPMRQLVTDGRWVNPYDWRDFPSPLAEVLCRFLQVQGWIA